MSVAMPTNNSNEIIRKLRPAPKKMFIAGRWTEAASGKTFSTLNPATGQPLRVAEGDKEDINLAVRRTQSF
jgi:acyl-CoA reductase-like NAD-dependent aldehyde dehydrogenase